MTLSLDAANPQMWQVNLAADPAAPKAPGVPPKVLVVVEEEGVVLSPLASWDLMRSRW